MRASKRRKATSPKLAVPATLQATPASPVIVGVMVPAWHIPNQCKWECAITPPLTLLPNIKDTFARPSCARSGEPRNRGTRLPSAQLVAKHRGGRAEAANTDDRPNGGRVFGRPSSPNATTTQKALLQLLRSTRYTNAGQARHGATDVATRSGFVAVLEVKCVTIRAVTRPHGRWLVVWIGLRLLGGCLGHQNELVRVHVRHTHRRSEHATTGVHRHLKASMSMAVMDVFQLG